MALKIRALGVSLVLAGACGDAGTTGAALGGQGQGQGQEQEQEQEQEPSRAQAQDREPVAEQKPESESESDSDSESESESASESESESEREPAPAFDPATATEATVEVTKLVDIPNFVCGVLHAVGAIEVEVLGVGEPRPKLGLYVSCPADLRPRGMLEVGKKLRVTLHRRAQSWPKPARRLDASLTNRYAKSLEPAAP